MLLTAWSTSNFFYLSCITTMQMFLAKLWDDFFPNFTADGVDIVRTFKQLLNQTSFTWKDGFTTESKLKTIHIHHQNQPSKAICERMVISPEVIEKGVAYITATKIGKQKNQTKPLGELPNAVHKSQIFQVFQIQRLEAN